ncbi:MAG: hypothetical protein K2H29_01825 [Oscillospiraceae bacterium]|nr:hypothetical protein [Oscillospiraceae bacterium]MDE5883810.1 hypothetical protein [Oscillospiraceae bacterium]
MMTRYVQRLTDGFFKFCLFVSLCDFVRNLALRFRLFCFLSQETPGAVEQSPAPSL